MNQPLHNNAIPAHPQIRAQQTGAPAPEAAVSAPLPIETSQREANATAMWDAFDETPAAPSPPEPVVPPSQAIQPPAAPEPPPELPPSVEELLVTGEVSTPAPVQREPQAPELQAAPQSAPDLAQMQSRAIDYLMANEYRLSDEDRTQLISAPDEVLPRLAARMHVGIATQLAQQVAAAVPAMIQQHMETHIKAQRAEMEFFGRYPKLNREEWKPTIAESLQMVKQMNPNATRQQIIDEGAALAAFRINSKFGNRYTPQPPQPPRSANQPYVPVAAGGGVTPPTNPNQPNVWADLAADPDWNPW
jgi:hypothetical protein